MIFMTQLVTRAAIPRIIFRFSLHSAKFAYGSANFSILNDVIFSPETVWMNV